MKKEHEKKEVEGRRSRMKGSETVERRRTRNGRGACDKDIY
jgi:hypothetical protein